MQYLGIDVGGTKICAALIENNKIIDMITVPTGDKPFESLRKAISSKFNSNVKGISLGVAGFSRNGFVFGHNKIKNWKKINLKRMLELEFHVPVKIINDAHAFALAEYLYGSAKGRKNVVGITIGTGVGSGIIIDGKLMTGKNGIEGEIGHMCIDKNGPACSCGANGCVEVYCNAAAIMDSYQKFSGIILSPEEISRRYKKDINAKKAIDEFSINLGIAISNICNVFHPEMIVIGGGLSNISYIYRIAEREMKKRAMPFLKDVSVRQSKLGCAAIPLGAVSLFD